MEFFFLTQNNRIEVIILIILLIIIVSIWCYRLYRWLRYIQTSLTTRTVRTADGTTVVKPPDPEIISDQIPEMREANPEALSTISPPETPMDTIDTSQIEKLSWLVSSVRTLIARGMTTEAQTLIVEWLSIDKDHRELNLLLGQIYEQDWQYEKAEYIYKDMADLQPNDIEILEKLANVLIVEKKYTIANEIYKKIHASVGNSESILYMLTHISHTLGDTESTLKYAKQYVLQWPKNPEIVSLLANTQVDLWLRRDAIETYKTLKNLTPYSNETTEILHKLLLEEELANNFEVKEV